MSKTIDANPHASPARSNSGRASRSGASCAGIGSKRAASERRCSVQARACRSSPGAMLRIQSRERRHKVDMRKNQASLSAAEWAALVDAIKTLIPVLDSFQRALQTSPEKSEFHAGVELIHKQLQDALAKIGVREILAKGEQFDPRFHEAIEMVDTEDAEDHQVLEELQRGYKLKDRLLRPAMVRVARNSRR